MVKAIVAEARSSLAWPRNADGPTIGYRSLAGILCNSSTADRGAFVVEEPETVTANLLARGLCDCVTISKTVVCKSTCRLGQQTKTARPEIRSSLGCAARGLALLDTGSTCDTYRTHACSTFPLERPAQLVLGRH
jgi:hypothetical protein